MTPSAKTARTTKVPGRLTMADRRTIERAIAGELEPRMVRAWLGFLLTRWDEREEMLRWREKPA